MELPEKSAMAVIESTTLELLLEKVSHNVSVVSKYLRENDLPQPSFDRHAPLKFVPSKSPAYIQTARQNLMEAALKLFQLTTGPSEYIPTLALGYHYLACLRWLAHYQIFQKVPLEGSICYRQLAESASVSEVHLKSISRMAMTNNLFHEPEDGYIAHTVTSAMFVTNANLYEWAVYMTERSARCASEMLEASIRWPRSLEKNHTAFNVVNDTDLTFFDWLDHKPEEREQFVRYMKIIRSSTGMGLEHLIEGFDWGSLGMGTVVDVGGSSGSVSIALAKVFPRLSFIVQDLPQNIVNATGTLSRNEPALSNRIKFQSYNFFEEQKVNGAEIYLLRMILHDWQPGDGVRILRNILPAMKETSRIIIMDVVLPKSGHGNVVNESLLRAREMTMLQSFNSTERDINDWHTLIRSTDERLKIMNVVQPVGSWMAILEVGFETSPQQSGFGH